MMERRPNMSMKTPIHIKIAILIILLAIGTQAGVNLRLPPPTESPWESGETIVTLSHDGTLTVSGNGAMADYVHFYARPNAPWLGSNRSITAVIIEDGVTHIGDGAFMYCGNMTSVTIPNSVTSIGKSAFHSTGLTSVTIPNSVTSIGDGAFFRSGLTFITIPSSVTEIGEGAFSECTDLISVIISDGVTFIGSDMFVRCINLKSITIPSSVVDIRCNAFFGSGLTSITIPNSVTSIGELAFAYSKLISITIPNRLTSIGDRAFVGCTDLASVTIPNSVTYIGSRAFARTNLTSVIVRKSKPIKIGNNVFEGIDMFNACLYVPANGIKAYRAADGWNGFYCIKPIKPTVFIRDRWFILGISTALILFVAIFVIIRKLRKP
jgi:hypothetical protein